MLAWMLNWRNRCEKRPEGGQDHQGQPNLEYLAFHPIFTPVETNLLGNIHDTPRVISTDWCLMREYARAVVIRLSGKGTITKMKARESSGY